MVINERVLLQPSHEHQDDHNEQYKSQASARGITPIAAVAPMGKSADEKKDEAKPAEEKKPEEKPAEEKKEEAKPAEEKKEEPKPAEEKKP